MTDKNPDTEMDAIVDRLIDEQAAKEDIRIMTAIDKNLTLEIQRIADKDFDGDYNKAHDILLHAGILSYHGKKSNVFKLKKDDE